MFEDCGGKLVPYYISCPRLVQPEPGQNLIACLVQPGKSYLLKKWIICKPSQSLHCIWYQHIFSKLKALNVKCWIKTERQVRRSFVGELDLNASEVEIVLDYFVYGRELFQPDELAFVEGRKPQQTWHNTTSYHPPPSPDFLDSPKLTAMLENHFWDISNFVNSEKGAPIQFHNGLPRVDGKYVKLYFTHWHITPR